jgi:VanZ family protein
MSLSDRWRHWYRRALPAYWIFLFCVTHFPKLSFGPDLPNWTDRIAHVVAFGLLAFLFFRFVQTSRRKLSDTFVWAAGVLLCVYAAVDEYLQQFVQRSPDVRDWACDAAGIIAVLALLEWRRRGAGLPSAGPSSAKLDSGDRKS